MALRVSAASAEHLVSPSANWRGEGAHLGSLMNLWAATAPAHSVGVRAFDKRILVNAVGALYEVSRVGAVQT